MKFNHNLAILISSIIILSNTILCYADEVTYDLENIITQSESQQNNQLDNNWLTKEIAKQVNKSDTTELTQEDFNKITKIELNNKQIETIPSEIGKLYNLKWLDLSNNKIKIIPSELKNLTNLQYLYLDQNEIQAIPVEIKDLNNLQYLSLNHNQIQTIPPELDNLTQLRYLQLNDNKITEVSSRIGNLVNLKDLTLSNNQISIIPIEISNLSELQHLDLDNNKISSIPLELNNLANLKYLYLHNQNIKLDNKHIVPAKEFTIQNPINLFGNPVVLTNISNAGVYNSSDNTITWLASDSNRDETFEFSQNGTLNGRAYTFSGIATLPTTIEKDEPLSLALSNGEASQTISTSETLNVPVSLKGTGDYYALDTQIEYDSDLLEFKGYSVKKGLKAYYSSNENNTLRYILASQGKDNPINSSVSDVVYLNFTPKQAGITNVKIKAGQVANLDKEIDISNLGNISVTIEDKPIVVSKDVNRDGKFSLIDLAIDGYYYGMSADETDKTKYDADIIPDGKIDDADLKEIVKLILNNKEN